MSTPFNISDLLSNIHGLRVPLSNWRHVEVITTPYGVVLELCEADGTSTRFAVSFAAAQALQDLVMAQLPDGKTVVDAEWPAVVRNLCISGPPYTLTTPAETPSKP